MRAWSPVAEVLSRFLLPPAAPAARGAGFEGEWARAVTGSRDELRGRRGEAKLDRERSRELPGET